MEYFFPPVFLFASLGNKQIIAENQKPIGGPKKIQRNFKYSNSQFISEKAVAGIEQFLFYQGFFHKHSRFTRQQGKGKADHVAGRSNKKIIVIDVTISSYNTSIFCAHLFKKILFC